MKNNKFVVVFLILFCTAWVAFSYWQSSESGWKELAILYKSEDTINYQNNMATLTMYKGTKVTYTNQGGIKVGTNEKGLFIKPDFVFSFGKKALQLPWSKISECGAKKDWVSIRITGTNVSITIKDSNGELLKECLKYS